MKSQAALLNELEEIKTRLIYIETTIIESEKPTKEVLAEYKKGRTMSYTN